MPLPRAHPGARECTVVIPVYNSQATLPALTERLAAVLPTIADRFEVVLVNDGSQDGSWEAICQAARKHPWVRGVNLMRNYGQHNALLAGIRAARYAVTVTMDDDLQHPPEEIPRLLGTLAQGNDLVYGVPALAPAGALAEPLLAPHEALAAPGARGGDGVPSERLPGVPDGPPRGVRPLRRAGRRHRRAARVDDDPHRVGRGSPRAEAPRPVAVQLVQARPAGDRPDDDLSHVAAPARQRRRIRRDAAGARRVRLRARVLPRDRAAPVGLPVPGVDRWRSSRARSSSRWASWASTWPASTIECCASLPTWSGSGSASRSTAMPEVSAPSPRREPPGLGPGVRRAVGHRDLRVSGRLVRARGGERHPR